MDQVELGVHGYQSVLLEKEFLVCHPGVEVPAGLSELESEALRWFVRVWLLERRFDQVELGVHGYQSVLPEEEFLACHPGIEVPAGLSEPESEALRWFVRVWLLERRFDQVELDAHERQHVLLEEEFLACHPGVEVPAGLSEPESEALRRVVSACWLVRRPVWILLLHLVDAKALSTPVFYPALLPCLPREVV